MKDTPNEISAGAKQMTVTMAWVTGRQILRCVCTGKANIEDCIRLLNQMADEPAPPQSCLLIDLLGVSGNLNIGDRQTLGIATAKAFAKVRRVAIVLKPGPHNGFGSLVARNRGLHVAVFSSEAAAMSWLS
jgi:hypothetical protein